MLVVSWLPKITINKQRTYNEAAPLEALPQCSLTHFFFFFFFFFFFTEYHHK